MDGCLLLPSTLRDYVADERFPFSATVYPHGTTPFGGLRTAYFIEFVGT